MKKYILTDVFEREMALPLIFDTSEAAMSAMVDAVAEVLKIKPDTILQTLHESGSYRDNECEVHETYAWANNGDGSTDFCIVELDTKTWRCAL